MLELKRVSFSYATNEAMGQWAIKSIDLKISDGETIVLAGHPGSGKSTLLQLLNGLLQPDSGEVYLDGLRPGSDDLPIQEACKRVGLVFQFPESQFFEDSVRAEVSFGPANMGLTGPEIELRVDYALGAVGLGGTHADRSPFSLSMGEMRRVAIASILAMDCPTLAFDEPMAGLDSSGRSLVQNTLVHLKKAGHTLIVATHDIDDMISIADRFVVLREGTIAFDGPPDELFDVGQDLMSMGIGMPQAVVVADRLRRQNWAIPQGILTFDGLAEAIINIKKGVS